jgi:hypothetical protein
MSRSTSPSCAYGIDGGLKPAPHLWGTNGNAQKRVVLSREAGEPDSGAACPDAYMDAPVWHSAHVI